MTADHPLVELMRRAASGDMPLADGALTIMRPPPGPADAVIAFTGHHVIAADVSRVWVEEHVDVADLAAPMSPSFLTALGNQIGANPGVVDVILCARGLRGAPEVSLSECDPTGEHPRLAIAVMYRRDVRAFTTADGEALLTLGRGLAGRLEASFEVEPRARNRGLGRALAEAALHLAGPDEGVFMQVAPGNAASLRTVLAAGYRPIGSEVLFLRRPAVSG